MARRTPVAHVVLPRPNLERPVSEFVWRAADAVAKDPRFDVERIVPVPTARALSSRARSARGRAAWPAEIVERLQALEPTPTIVPYLPLPGRSLESAGIALAASLALRRPERRPALLHGSFLDEGGHLATVAARALEVPSIAVAHGTEVELALARVGPRARRARETLRHATELVAISRALVAKLARLGRSAELVYYTADAGAFAPSPPPPGARLLFVGRLSRGKGVDVLLEAMRALPPEVTLRLVGPRSTELPLEALGDRVEWVGELPAHELGRQYAECACLVLPSRAEGLGIVLVEALLSGRPCVTTDVGGPAEVIGDHNGAIVPPGDAPALAEGILRTLRRRFDPAALRASALPLTWSRMEPRLAALTARALQGQAPIEL